MKRLALGIVLLMICSVGFAKDYTVTVDDKYVEYFEKAFANEDFTPAEWLAMQAINLADQVINKEYLQKTVTDKTRDEKIAEIEKEK